MRDYCEPLARQGCHAGLRRDQERLVSPLWVPSAKPTLVSAQFVPVSLVIGMVSMAREKQQASLQPAWGLPEVTLLLIKF